MLIRPSLIRITRQTIKTFFLVILLCISCSGCLERGPNPTDPYEARNRKMYEFNDKFDTKILKPLARCYNKHIPSLIRNSVTHFFSNLSEISSFANNLLECKPKAALITLTRFWINSTMGIAGLHDVATEMGLKQQYADFGLTLMKWGDVNSPYTVSPFMGPSTYRDSVAMLFDIVLFSVYPHIPSFPAAAGLWTYSQFHRRAELLHSEALIEATQIDGYVQQRDAYLQHRKYLLAGGDPDAEPDLYVEGNDADNETAMDTDAEPDLYVEEDETTTSKQLLADPTKKAPAHTTQ